MACDVRCCKGWHGGFKVDSFRLQKGALGCIGRDAF